MDLDALLLHYFGTTDLDALDDDALDEGHRKVTLAFAVEREPGRRFALWIVLHALGDAPSPEKAFKNPAERRAAEDYARAANRLDDEE
jgi:hypothetical protein